MTCSQCCQPAPSGAEFCPECDAKLIAPCPACGVANAPGIKFCKKCGRPLGVAAPPPSPQSYTPAHLAEKILDARGALEGERKHVTVLFADMKGSMELPAEAFCFCLGARRVGEVASTPTVRTLPLLLLDAARAG